MYWPFSADATEFRIFCKTPKTCWLGTVGYSCWWALALNGTLWQQLNWATFQSQDAKLSPAKLNARESLHTNFIAKLRLTNGMDPWLHKEPKCDMRCWWSSIHLSEVWCFRSYMKCLVTPGIPIWEEETVPSTTPIWVTTLVRLLWNLAKPPSLSHFTPPTITGYLDNL